MNQGEHKTGPVIEWEKMIVAQMIQIFCEKKHHSPKGMLCDECNTLLKYSHKRLDFCQFGEKKPTCRKCPVHCYSSTQRERIRKVMRFSGPHLFFRSPIRWIRHALHDRSKMKAIRKQLDKKRVRGGGQLPPG